MRIQTIIILYLFTACPFFFGTIPCFAQKVKVEQSKENIGGSRNNAYITTIYQSTESDVIKEWKSLLKEYQPLKISGKGEVFADNAKILSISDNTIDIYATAKGKENEVKFIAGFDLGGVFLSSDHSGSKTAERIVYDFAVKMTSLGIESEMKESGKVLAKFEKDLEKLVKANDRLHQDIDRYNKQIEDAKAGIEQAQKNIEANLIEQETAKKVVENQKNSVNKVADKLKSVK